MLGLKLVLVAISTLISISSISAQKKHRIELIDITEIDPKHVENFRKSWDLLDHNRDGQVSIHEASLGLLSKSHYYRNDDVDNSYKTKKPYASEYNELYTKNNLCSLARPDGPHFIDCVVSRANIMKSHHFLPTQVLEFYQELKHYFLSSSCNDVKPTLKQFYDILNHHQPKLAAIFMKENELISPYYNEMKSCYDMIHLDHGSKSFKTLHDLIASQMKSSSDIKYELNKFLLYSNMCNVLTEYGYCKLSCRKCDEDNVEAVTETRSDRRHLKSSSSDDISVSVLISSDWHIEPWYVPSSDENVARYANPTIDNMWNCFDSDSKSSTNYQDDVTDCYLNSESDPYLSFVDSHMTSFESIIADMTVTYKRRRQLLSEKSIPIDTTDKGIKGTATKNTDMKSVTKSGKSVTHDESVTKSTQKSSTIAVAKKSDFTLPVAEKIESLLFYIGDTQAHDYNSDDFGTDIDVPDAIAALMKEAVTAMTKRWEADDIFIAPGNNDGPHNAIFVSGSSDEQTEAWAEVLLTYNIVNDDLRRSYEYSFDESTDDRKRHRRFLKASTHKEGRRPDNGRLLSETSTTTLSQTEFFEQTGYYMKQIDPSDRYNLKEKNLFCIIYNTNLGATNSVQRTAFLKDLEYISSINGGVYILGHHPDITKIITPSTYQSIVKGIFSGHIHVAISTDKNLFTQVPAISQDATDTAFYLGTISSSSNYEITVSRDKDLFFYQNDDGEGQDVNVTLWQDHK